MAAALPFIAVGLQLYGNYKSSQDQADAARSNAQAYESQAQYIESVGKRKLELLERDQGNFLDLQKARFAKSGLGFGGSAMDALVDTQIEQHKERIAAQTEIAQEASLARQHGASYSNMANNLTSPGNLAVSSGAIFFGSRAAANIFGSNPPKTTDSNTVAKNGYTPNPYGTVSSNGTTATSEYVVDHWRKSAGGSWERVS